MTSSRHSQKRRKTDPVALFLAATPLAVSALATLLELDSRVAVIALATLTLACALASLWRIHQRLGRGYEVGAAMINLALIFWFLAPGLTAALSTNQFHEAAARIRISNADAVTAYLGVSIFFFCFVTSYQLISVVWVRKLQRRLFGTAQVRNPMRTLRILVIGAVLSLAFYSIVSGGIFSALQFIAGSRTVRKPWDLQGNYGTSLSPFHIFFSGILLAVSVHSTHLLLSRRFPLLTRVILVLTAALPAASIAVESGTRSVLLLCIAPGLIIFYREQRERAQRFRLSTMVVIGVFMIGALIAANFQREYRSTGKLGDSTDVSVKDNDMLTQTAYAVAISRLEPLTHDSPFLHIITGPIPRFLWKSKPESRAMIVHSRYIRGYDITKRGGNSLPSIVGQYLLSWGWFGVFEIGFWLGLIVGAGDKMFAGLAPRAVGRLGYAIFTTYLFVSFRTIGFFFFTPVVITILMGHVLARPRRGSESGKRGSSATNFVATEQTG